MGKMKERINQFAWELHDRRRTALSVSLGAVTGVIGWKWLGLTGKVAFLSGWIMAMTIYLVLLGIVIFHADGAMTRQRVSKDEPSRVMVLIVLIIVALLGNISVGVILSWEGNKDPAHTRLLVGLSVWAVIMSWCLLHAAVGQHYARLYYDETDAHGRPFPGGMRQGFVFPGNEQPNYPDFMYISFTVGLTYAVSDVNVTSAIQRRMVLMHSIISFFFYSMILGVVLNAIVTS
ncbi:MAG: DUF1345 domain-containing protein [Syntrophobacteraceae bacterium]